MNKLLPLLALSALTVGAVQAREITPQQALTRFHASDEARKIPSQQGTESLVRTVATPDGERAALYLYARPQGGFLVLTADDALPSLIGWADQGQLPLNADDTPDGLRWLLDGFAKEVQTADMLQKAGITPTPNILRSASERETVGQLCFTTWDQDKPYNNLAPHVGGTCPTGCVATATAQVLRYHQHPAMANGSISYEYTASNGTLQHLEADFDSVALEWQYMIRDYSSNNGGGTGKGGTIGGYTARQAEAVAKLMWVCGYGSRMMYNPAGSGTFDFEAARCLVDFLDMNPGLWVARRRYNTAAQWDELIYNELQNHRPVIYVGADGTVSGHCFVADGYKNGTYHINWGWGGSSDGYFRLENLVTGGWWGYDFTWDMGALIDVRPNDGTGTLTPQLALNSGSFCTDRDLYSRTDDEMVQVSSEPGSENTEEQNCKYFWNFTPGAMPQTEPGIRLVSLDNPADTAYATADAMDIEVGQRIKHYDIPASRFPEGNWKGDMGFRAPDGQWYEIPVELIGRRELTFEVTPDQVKVTGLDQNPNLNVTVSNLSVPASFRTGSYVSISAKLTNHGDPIYTTVFPQIQGVDGRVYWADPTIVLLNTGSYKTITSDSRFRHEDEFTGEADYPEPGTYTFRLATDGGLTLGEPRTVSVLTQGGTAVETIEADGDAQVIATERFTLSGQRASSEASGLLLVRETLSDGSTRSRLQVVE